MSRNSYSPQRRAQHTSKERGNETRPSRHLVLFLILFSVMPFVNRPTEAYAFVIFGDLRIANPGGGGPAVIPSTTHWAVAAAGGVPTARTLNITFNTTPGAAVAAPDRAALAAAVATWAGRAPVAGANFDFPVGGLPAGTPQKPGGLDLESIVLHELGHAFGLSHPNLADRGARGIRRLTASLRSDVPPSYHGVADANPGSRNDVRGVVGPPAVTDLSLMVVDADNNPFNAAGGVVDKRTYFLGSLNGPGVPAPGTSQQTSTREVAAAGLAVTGFGAIANHEAVMVQGVWANERHRALSSDDENGLRYLQSGVDNIDNPGPPGPGNDDYVFAFVWGGLGAAGGRPVVDAPAVAPPAGTQILISDIPLGPGDVAITGFIRPFATAVTLFDVDEATGNPVARTDIWLNGPIDSPGTEIQFVDIIIATPVPEPSMFVLGALALASLGVFTWRRRGCS